MRREEMEAARKHMTRAEIERMGERQAALERDRYKPDEVVARREAELLDEFASIKQRVERRVPLYEAEGRRQAEMARELSEVLDDPGADEAAKARAMKKMLHAPFADLGDFLTDAETTELEECRARPLDDAATHERMERLLAAATERRIEAKIDEMLATEDDVLV